ncbi:MAG: sigma 54-interacting transcriptional regulator [bacterium]
MAELIGNSPAITAVRAQIDRLVQQFARTRRPPIVLLEGETGTGKGLIARMLHRSGPRAGGRFVDINCAAIPETLLEAELFGFERGAFTDARQAKPGLFQTADGGVLFLDEIGLLPRGLQAKLLKVVEERTIRRIGSTSDTAVDVWIIAATNEDLAVAVQEGRVRQDLYHRIAGLTIRLPPLRERGEDIRALAEYFLKLVCGEYGLPPRRLSSDAVMALHVYSWPGNVRELANVIERAVLLDEKPEIMASSLGLPVSSRSVPAATPGTSPPLRASVDRVEREQLLGALHATGGNISSAADRLGIPRNTLRYRMARYGLRSEGVVPRRRKAIGPGLPTPPVPRPASSLSVSRGRRQVAWLYVALPDAETTTSATAGRLRQLLLDKIDAFGGRVEELVSPGIIAVFGLASAEDFSRRAAHAALAMRKAAEREAADRRVPVTVVIDLGDATLEESDGVRRVASESVQAAAAKLVTLTARVKVPTVVTTQTAARAIGRWFDIEALPVEEETGPPLYKLVTAISSGFGLGAERRRSHFVGRDRELALLQEYAAQLANRKGRVVGLVSEPGGGKSRLLYEFREHLVGETPRYAEARCLQHSSGVPYQPLVDLLQQTWRLDEAESSEALAARIHGQLEPAGLDPGEYGYCLLRLFGLTAHDDPMSRFSPEAIKRRTFDAIRRIILGSNGSLVLAVEDLHWTDKTSEEFFASIVDTCPGSPLLFVSTYRPGYRPPWIDRSYVSQLALGPLSKSDARAIVRPIMAAAKVSDLVTETVVERGGGNPFFLEELALGVVHHPGEESAAIPRTVGDVLTDRLERLPPRLREVMDAAAIVGRELRVPVLEAMLDERTDLAESLRELVGSELLYEHAGSIGRAGPTYSFKHALIQEVAYERVGPTDRSRLHGRAGRAFEDLYAGRLDEVLDRLAHHFGRTGETQKAIEYLTGFAEKAATVYSLTEAVTGLDEAMTHAERLVEPGPRDSTLVRLATQKAFPLILLGRFDEALRDLNRYQASVDRVDDPRVTGPYYLWLGLVHTHTGRHSEAMNYARRCIDLATTADDKPTKGIANVQLSIDCFFLGKHRQGREHASQALTFLDERSGWWLAHAYWIFAWNLVILGDLLHADEAASNAIEVGNRMAEPRLQAYGMSVLGWIAALRDDTSAAMNLSERALAIAPDPLSTAVVLTLAGYARLSAGRVQQAIDALQKAADHFQTFQFREMEVWARAWLNEARLVSGDVTGAEHGAREIVTAAESVGFPYAVALAQRTIGRVALRAKDRVASAEYLGAALRTFGSIEARDEVARTRFDLSSM